MLVENQMIEVAWHSQNKNHYISKGYVFTKYKDKFLVKAEDLSHGATASVDVVCDFCGDVYDMKWYHYVLVAEKGQKNACRNCRHTKMYENNLKARQDSLYEKALNVCKEKGYILVTKKEDILCNTSYVTYICPKHGTNRMRIANLIFGKKCPACAREEARERYKTPCDEVAFEIASLGGELLNKEDYLNSSTKNLDILCPNCKKEVIRTSRRNFTQHGGQVCESCSKLGSNGERKIKEYLESHNIKFEQEKWFSDCRDIKPLPFDFYLEDYDLIIEYDGEQHYKDRCYKTGLFSDTLEYTKKHDEIKNAYCAFKNIRLIRIPYWEYNNIESILYEELILHEDIV